MSTTRTTDTPTKSPASHGGGWLARAGSLVGHATCGWSSSPGWSCSASSARSRRRSMSALSGAGWQDSGSSSVAGARRHREELRRARLHRPAGRGRTTTHGPIASDPAAQQVIAKATALLKADSRVSTVVAPQRGVSLSRDGRTAIIQAGAAANANDMVRAADDLIDAADQPVRRQTCR